jgi:hypothetical protein
LPNAKHGPIKSITLPSDWRHLPSEPEPMVARSMIVFRPLDNNEASINLYHRGIPINKQSAERFHTLLNSGNEERELVREEIIALAAVFGQAGRNQFMLDETADRSVQAAFILASAKLTSINGCNVISVWGNFHHANQGTGSEFFGIFIDGSNDGSQVWEVFFQANDKIKFLMYLGDFESALKSIVWN